MVLAAPYGRADPYEPFSYPTRCRRDDNPGMRTTVLAWVLALVAAPTAVAASFTFGVVTASPVTLPAVTLNGDDQTQTFTVVSEVDNSGQAGWKVQASAGPPSAGAGTLPALQVTGGSWSCVSGCPSAPAPSGVSYPVVLSASPQTIYNAGAGTGRGKFDVSSTVLVSYPASTIAGTYSATITLSGSTGP